MVLASCSNALQTLQDPSQHPLENPIMASLGVNIDHLAKVFILPYEGGEQWQGQGLQAATAVHATPQDSHCSCNASATFACICNPL
jgi:hypothetical protein